MIIGHVGVRMGSRGVTGKNFRDMLGKPLIDWSLDQLLQHPRVSHVVVSTDDPGIRLHAVAKGCLDLGLRPAELATDTAAKWDVWQHALAKTEELAGKVDVFIDLDCTAPLRSVEDIDGALDLFLDERPDMVMSCTQARKNPYLNSTSWSRTRTGFSRCRSRLKAALSPDSRRLWSGSMRHRPMSLIQAT